MERGKVRWDGGIGDWTTATPERKNARIAVGDEGWIMPKGWLEAV